MTAESLGQRCHRSSISSSTLMNKQLEVVSLFYSAKCVRNVWAKGAFNPASTANWISSRYFEGFFAACSKWLDFRYCSYWYTEEFCQLNPECDHSSRHLGRQPCLDYDYDERRAATFKFNLFSQQRLEQESNEVSSAMASTTAGEDDDVANIDSCETRSMCMIEAILSVDERRLNINVEVVQKLCGSRRNGNDLGKRQ